MYKILHIPTAKYLSDSVWGPRRWRSRLYAEIYIKRNINYDKQHEFEIIEDIDGV